MNELLNDVEDILFNCRHKYYKKTFLNFYDRNGNKYTLISDYDYENSCYNYTLSENNIPFLRKESEIRSYIEKLENEETI